MQEALLRLQQSERESVQNVEAWLTTVVTRLSIDTLRSARHRREVYPGEWLPEPIYLAPSPEQAALTRSRLSIGLLYLLEKLEPEQRVVFVLREVFEYPYRSVAGIIGKSEGSCRQLMVRARAELGRSKGQSVASSSKVSPFSVDRFIVALEQGDEEELLRIIAPDARLVGDGGGKVPSVMNVLQGADRIVRFFRGLRLKFGDVWERRSATVNAAPGALVFRDGALVGVVSLDEEGGRISAIYLMSNPDKIGDA